MRESPYEEGSSRGASVRTAKAATIQLTNEPREQRLGARSFRPRIAKWLRAQWRAPAQRCDGVRAPPARRSLPADASNAANLSASLPLDGLLVNNPIAFGRRSEPSRLCPELPPRSRRPRARRGRPPKPRGSSSPRTAPRVRICEGPRCRATALRAPQRPTRSPPPGCHQ